MSAWTAECSWLIGKNSRSGRTCASKKGVRYGKSRSECQQPVGQQRARNNRGRKGKSMELLLSIGQLPASKVRVTWHLVFAWSARYGNYIPATPESGGTLEPWLELVYVLRPSSSLLDWNKTGREKKDYDEKVEGNSKVIKTLNMVGGGQWVLVFIRKNSETSVVGLCSKKVYLVRVTLRLKYGWPQRRHT